MDLGAGANELLQPIERQSAREYRKDKTRTRRWGAERGLVNLYYISRTMLMLRTLSVGSQADIPYQASCCWLIVLCPAVQLFCTTLYDSWPSE